MTGSGCGIAIACAGLLACSPSGEWPTEPSRRATDLVAKQQLDLPSGTFCLPHGVADLACSSRDEKDCWVTVEDWLRIAPQKPNTAELSLLWVRANFHTCQYSTLLYRKQPGLWVGDDEDCTVTVNVDDVSVAIDAEGVGCRDHCGLRATLDAQVRKAELIRAAPGARCDVADFNRLFR